MLTEEVVDNEEVTEDLRKVIDHLKAKAEKGLGDRTLQNGSKLTSKSLRALDANDQKFVRQRLNGFRIANSTSGQEYRITWDEELYTFFLVKSP